METIKGDLLIKGDLICGDDGILDATGDVTWGFYRAEELGCDDARLDLLKDVPEGDFNLAGRQVRVEGNCYVFGNIIYDEYNYKGHVSAWRE